MVNRSVDQTRPAAAGRAVQAPGTPAILRVLPFVRSAIVESARAKAPSTYVYLTQKPDFDPALDPRQLGFRRATRLSLLGLVARRHFDVVQLPEPMWVRQGPANLIIMAIVRVRDRFQGRRTLLVAHAIENSPITQLPLVVARVGAWWAGPIWTAACRALVRAQASRLDRIAFGTEGAREAFDQALGSRPLRREPERAVFEMTPVACHCDGPARDTRLVAFVGRLEQRKGVDHVLNAWPAVRSAIGEARLVIAGDGPLEGAVRAVAGTHPSVSPAGLLGRHAVHELYRRAAVVVMPSQPEGRWREQVGRPVIEAAAHGCRVVTTDQTGLAHWLERNGQYIVPTACSMQELAGTIVQALSDARTEPRATYALPDTPGEAVADQWLVSAEERC